MKYINCPNCGSRLLEGDNGSHIVLKCCKCSKLFEVTVNMAGVIVIPKTGANRKGGIAKTGILSPDKLRTVEDISRIAQRGQAFYDYGGTILKFGKYADIDVSTKSFLHLHLWFTHAHLPLGTVLAGFIGGF